MMGAARLSIGGSKKKVEGETKYSSSTMPDEYAIP
jgi:hypothetical protein